MRHLDPEQVLWTQVPLHLRVAWWGKLQYARHTYRFSFRYFDSWALVKLHRYIHRQLPIAPAELSLYQACRDEVNALEPILTNAALLPHPPALVMDFGCGIGRSSVFFHHVLGWQTTKFLLVDGQQTAYGDKANMPQVQRGFTANAHDLAQSFYTDFDLVDRFLLSNGVQQYDLVDLTTEAARLPALRGLDLFYSFHCVGWHFDPATVFDTYHLYESVKPGGLVILGIRKPDNNGHPLNWQPFVDHGYQQIALMTGQRKQDFVILRKL